ncbi:MAG: hypothetical protein ACTSSI_18285 [Candidatus Helarchaeota archaeon]
MTLTKLIFNPENNVKYPAVTPDALSNRFPAQRNQKNKTCIKDREKNYYQRQDIRSRKRE